jgi:FemAB family protein
MVAKIKNNIQDEHKNISFDLSEWNTILKSTPNALVSHLKHAADYSVAYFEGDNLSFVLSENNKVVCIFPLFVYQNNNEWIISGSAEGLTQPLFIRDIAKKTKKRLESQIVTIIYAISKKLGIKKVNIFEHNAVLSSWYMLWVGRACKHFLTYRLAIDLTLTIDEIRLGFRKSYKPLISKAKREWDIEVHEGNVEDVFEEFRLLHEEVSGRVTRSMKSWNVQKKQIECHEAFLITARDGGVLIGAGLFNYTKDIGNYSVGAYKRELFEKPIGHGVQMKAIEVLIDKGCKMYDIGQKMTLLDENTPTDKELSISYFKEGFAGYVYARPYLEVNIIE